MQTRLYNFERKKMRFVDTLFFWIVSALPFFGEIHAVTTAKGKEEQEHRELVKSAPSRIVGFVWIDIANPNRPGVPLNESGNNFNISDFPKGATVEAITSEGMVGGNRTNKTGLLWNRRPDCFIDPSFFFPLSYPNKYGKSYMCGFSTVGDRESRSEEPLACELFSSGPINDTVTRCFTVTDRATLDEKNFSVSIYGALGPSSVYYEVQSNKWRPLYWVQLYKTALLYIFFLTPDAYDDAACLIYQDGDSENVLSKFILQGANLELGYADDGWSPESVMFNYDNGSIVRLVNDRPFTLLKGTSFRFTPSPGKHTITATLYSERNAKGASISHTVSFRVVRKRGLWCF
jgi:hypothetical protein